MLIRVYNNGQNIADKFTKLSKQVFLQNVLHQIFRNFLAQLLNLGFYVASWSFAIESAKLCAQRALVPYVPRALRALVPQVSRALRALVPHGPLVLRALVPQVLSQLTCCHALHAPRALCLASFMCQYHLFCSCFPMLHATFSYFQLVSFFRNLLQLK